MLWIVRNSCRSGKDVLRFTEHTMKYLVVEKDTEYALRMDSHIYGTVEAANEEDAMKRARQRFGARSLTGLRLILVEEDPYEAG